MSETPDNEKDVERLEATLRTLGEHYDSVHIFASRCEQGSLDGTVHVQRGTGNWFARYGQISLWVERERERERDEVRKRSEI